jgi:hypothetical protein
MMEALTKRRSVSTRLHGAISQKTAVFEGVHVHRSLLRGAISVTSLLLPYSEAEEKFDYESEEFSRITFSAVRQEYTTVLIPTCLG